MNTFNQLNTRKSRKLFKKLGIPGSILLIIVMAAAYFFVDSTSTSELTDDRVEVTVDRYIDGDTTRFNYDGASESFRYLIIDAPELNGSNGESQPYAVEAADRTQELLEDADKIEVEFDVGPETDHYGRYLAYVYADGEMVNEILVREGLATVEYLNPPNTSHQQLLEEAEEKAKEEKQGVWSLE